MFGVVPQKVGLYHGTRPLFYPACVGVGHDADRPLCPSFWGPYRGHELRTLAIE